MSTVINGSSPSITFSDGTTQSTAVNISSPYTANGVVYASSTSALATGSGLVFDGSNLGLGVTPSAWQAYTAIQIGNGCVANYSPTGDFNIVSNAYYQSSGAWKYITSSVKSSKLQIANGAFQYYISTDGTQTAGSSITYSAAMTLDNSGNLLVGTTSFAPTSNQGISLQPPQNGNYGITVTSSISTVSSGGLQMYSTGAGAYRFYVDFSGTIHATNTSITAISDQSLKTNIKPLETGLTQILALQPRRFDWTEESKNEARNVAGFIAQEVEQVLPDLVAPFRYNDTETKLGLKMGDMIPTLVKAIQELNTLVTAQAAEITALKAKVGA